MPELCREKQGLYIELNMKFIDKYRPRTKTKQEEKP